MTRQDFELIHGKIQSGELSCKQAIEDVILFIARNKPMYGIQMYDEDFISEFFIYFLERAEKTFLSYDKTQGNFFSYIFCFVRNCCMAVKKQRTSRQVIDHFNTGECISDYEERQSAYEQINYDDFDRPKVPYNYTPIKPKYFQLACKSDKYLFKPVKPKTEPPLPPEVREKLKAYSPILIRNMIMVLALKSAYYITEEQISNISLWFNIDKKILEMNIQEIKTEMYDRIIHKEQLIERRNKVYFQRQKLKDQIEWNKRTKANPEYYNEPLRRKYQKTTNTLNMLNYQMKEGMIHIRPSTRVLAKYIDKSPRQITYYQTIARKIGLDINKV